MIFDEFDRAIRDISEKIIKDRFQPDIIVGIARGGWIPARLLSKYLSIKNLQSFGITYVDSNRLKLIVRDEPSPTPEGQKILLVEDFLESGKSMNMCQEILTGNGNFVKTFAVGYLDKSIVVPDYSSGRVGNIPKLPWD